MSTPTNTPGGVPPVPQTLLQQVIQQPIIKQRKMLRPSQKEILNTTLKETSNGSLIKTAQPLGPSIHVRSNTLSDLLQKRSAKEDLVRTNVLPETPQQGSLVQKQAQTLLKQQRRDSLQAQLISRPTLEALAERNVYRIHPDDEGSSHIPLAMEFHHDQVAQEFITVPHRIEGLQDIVEVACGWSHSLALARDGTVYSWGSNLSGRLGRPVPKTGTTPTNAATTNSIPPEEGALIKPDAQAMLRNLQKKNTISDEFAKSDANTIVEQHSTPVRIPGLQNCVKIACGDHHSAALCKDGLYVWGRNEFGMLGLGHREDVPRPTRVDISPIIHALGLPENSKIDDFALGANHTVIIIHGKALAAGWNKSNRLGLVSTRHFIHWPAHHDEDRSGDTTVIARFQPIKGLAAPMRTQPSLCIRNVAAGDVMTIAIADVSQHQPNHNNVFLWGTSMHSSPYPIIELNGVEIRQVTMGSNFCMLLTAAGEVCCFGSNRDYQLGRPASTDMSSFHAPAPIKIEAKYCPQGRQPIFQQVASGKYHALAIDNYGRLFGWGLNKHGMCGTRDGDLSTQPPTPVDITTVLNEKSQPLFATAEQGYASKFYFTRCAGGASHTLCVDNSGFVYAMGSFRSGKLGL